MNALWKVGEFRSGDKIELCLATADKIEAYEKHHSFVRWVYEHQGVYQCSGCGRKTDDPDKDYTALRDAGHISCCPDRKMVLAADAFKSYVHQRLDEMGVPHSLPDSEHDKAGCRVGGRLDWVEANVKRWQWIEDKWSMQKTSESERFLDTLGIEGETSVLLREIIDGQLP